MKNLLFFARYSKINKQDCNRYALKREVAALCAGFSVEYVRF